MHGSGTALRKHTSFKEMDEGGDIHNWSNLAKNLHLVHQARQPAMTSGDEEAGDGTLPPFQQPLHVT